MPQIRGCSATPASHETSTRAPLVWFSCTCALCCHCHVCTIYAGHKPQPPAQLQEETLHLRLERPSPEAAVVVTNLLSLSLLGLGGRPSPASILPWFLCFLHRGASHVQKAVHHGLLVALRRGWLLGCAVATAALLVTSRSVGPAGPRVFPRRRLLVP